MLAAADFSSVSLDHSENKMKANYLVVGTNDLEASAKFYDSLFEKT